MDYEFLKRFCSSDRVGSVAEKPFLCGNKTLATNGHIALLVDGKFTDDLNDYDLSKLELDFSGEMVSPPKFDCEEKCHSCKGSGYTREIKCENCSSTGWVDLEDDAGNDYEVSCKSCGGDGGDIVATNEHRGERCGSCKGTGEMVRDGVLFGAQTMKGYDLKISYVNLSLLSLLDNVKISKNWQNDCPKTSFSFDGGVGIVMAMRKEKSPF